VASKSKRSTHDKTKFTEAEKNWNLEKLYEDLRAAKQKCSPGRRKVLTDREKCHLRGLLCGYSPEKIAKERVVDPKGVSTALSTTLYCYIKEMFDYTKEIRHWGDVPNFLDQAGYKIQISEQSQSSHSLPDKIENTLEASHKVEANSIRECFSKSIDQLGNDKLYVRIGAIYALEKIAKDSVTENWTIMEYLAAFVRNAPRRKEEEGIPDDIQAALTVIGRRNPDNDKESLNLRNTDIRGAKLFGADLQGANLFGADLREVCLTKANLKGAVLTTANLKGAVLWEANLEGAKLDIANLEEAKLRKTNLQRANFSCSILRRTDFNKAKLQEANLSGADLRKADLTEANLERAYLYGANLQEASLMRAEGQRADLRRVYLQGTNLSGADFSRAKNLKLDQLKLASGNSTTVLPDDVERPAHWKHYE
jgi:uncharacterized protein YjbI with pentapeptide repeats